MKILIFTFWTFIFPIFVLTPKNEFELSRKLKREIKRVWKEDAVNLSYKNIKLKNNYSQSELYEVNKNEKTIGYIFDVKCNSCHVGGCKSSNNQNNNNYEFFRFYLFLSTDFDVLKISIYDYQATHGQEIANNFWLKQFIGYNGSQLLRYGKEVDAISGATVSSEALINEIHYLLSLKSQILEIE